MQENKIDLEKFKTFCQAMIKNTSYKGEAAGINAAMDAISDIPDNDLFKGIEQARWEAIIDLEFEITREAAKLQDKLTGIRQVRALYHFGMNIEK